MKWVSIQDMQANYLYSWALRLALHVHRVVTLLCYFVTTNCQWRVSCLRFDFTLVCPVCGQVVRQEGPAALWKGNLVTILHRLPYSSINFYTYERTQKLLQRTLPGTTDFARAWMAGATAGLVSCSAVSRPGLALAAGRLQWAIV